MSLSRHDFTRFFAALHDDHPPYAWQGRLLDQVLDGGWPDALDPPTGAGKTSVIDVHVFALALAASRSTPVPPRRLAMIVDRRVLVDDQYRYAQHLSDRLAAAEGGILGEIGGLLLELQHGDTNGPTGQEAPQPLMVARLRGGEPPARRWADHPTAAAVLCATPEMWGSRLLFRGYGSSSRAWPREAGLLALDTVAVVDEAHLARQLLHTARRVAQLVPVADRKWDGPAPVQVVETTATPAEGGERRLGVTDHDLAHEPGLRAKLCRPKPVTLVARKDWATTRPRHTVVDEYVAQTIELLRQAGEQAGAVGCFVNTVARAVALTAALRAARVEGRELTVVMLCGQVRSIDVELLELRYPGLLSPAGNAEVDVLVSTQTLEVGVDLDLAAMVTELAAATALVQRAGRVNRRGLRDEAPIVVIVPDGDIRTGSGPYDSATLTASRDWLTDRAQDPNGLAPWAVRAEPPPTPPSRRILQRLELGQAWQLARTSDDLAAEPQLDLWLSDDLEQDFSVGLVVRRDLPPDTGEAVELLRVLRPRRHEVFSVPLHTARTALSRVRDELRRLDRHAELNALRIRGEDTEPLSWQNAAGGDRLMIRPGDVIVVDAATSLFSAGDQQSPPVVVAADELRPSPAADVLEATAHIGAGPRRGEVVHRIELDDGRNDALAEDLRAVGEADDSPLATRAVVRAWLDRHHGGDPMARAAGELLAEAGEREVDVVLQPADGPPRRVLVIDSRRRGADEYVRQEWTPSSKRVTLAAHQRDVAQRLTDLATRTGLAVDLVEALRVAALHHDDGKADPRFQLRLGARADEEPLAKSHGAVGPETARRRHDRSGLPLRWRHEQRSVLDAWNGIEPQADRDLAARLIGTTHGHGRSSFPHTAALLLAPTDPPELRAVAEALFDSGGWDELIEHTQQLHGVWGCAYLEALLRAADGQISAEGR
jgi:CRISPR-associated endonuclease/helicase Cas3